MLLLRPLQRLLQLSEPGAALTTLLLLLPHVLLQLYGLFELRH
jgi:hypothetical protein